MMKGKHIIIGVTGSIAAYKAAMLVRLLTRAGAEVRVVMTPAARAFITPLTMATVSAHPILVDFFDPEDGRWNSHVSLGEWADAYVVAPATANTLAKMATGVADNLLLTTYLSARCPVFVAPAMDMDMFAHATTQQNLDTLRARGVYVVEPGEGELASGLVGKGRMAEPEEIADYLVRHFGGATHSDAHFDAACDEGEKKKSLNNRKFLVTAGPTVEAVDPVRFLSNHSTGKMGYAIAGELAARGARVTLVSGPTALTPPRGVDFVAVTSAEQMLGAAREAFGDADGAVLCAAVADYAPAEPSASKIKKNDDELTLRLRRTPDIAAELGRMKGGRLLVGFALETDNEMANARGKMERKNLDFVVLNSLNDRGAGFGVETNKVAILGRDGSVTEHPLALKTEVAREIVEVIEGWFGK
jgi:phosphopantothenoylcysteine decarboxylase/phosphopantothenate--cysteine ligase